MEFDEWLPSAFMGRKGAGDRTVQTLENHFLRWANELPHQEALESCARNLVAIRHKRMQIEAPWMHFATGVRFSCDQCDHEDFSDRDEFEKHLTEEHEFTDEKMKEERSRKVRTWRYKSNETFKTM